MYIHYKSHGIEITESMQEYVATKLALLDKLFNGEAVAETLFSRDEKHQSGLVYRVDITVTSSGEKTHAVGHGETMYAAIDIAKDELGARVRRGKKMHVQLIRKGGAALKRMMKFGR